MGMSPWWGGRRYCTRSILSKSRKHIMMTWNKYQKRWIEQHGDGGLRLSCFGRREYGLLSHWRGVRWRQYTGLLLGTGAEKWRGVDGTETKQQLHIASNPCATHIPPWLKTEKSLETGLCAYPVSCHPVPTIPPNLELLWSWISNNKHTSIPGGMGTYREHNPMFPYATQFKHSAYTTIKTGRWDGVSSTEYECIRASGHPKRSHWILMGYLWIRGRMDLRWIGVCSISPSQVKLVIDITRVRGYVYW